MLQSFYKIGLKEIICVDQKNFNLFILNNLFYGFWTKYVRGKETNRNKCREFYL